MSEINDTFIEPIIETFVFFSLLFFHRHVHTLTGEDCKDGAFIKDIGPDTMIASFKNIGIQRTVKNNFPKPDYIEMDKNTLRLRFEVNLLDYKLAGSSTLIAYSCPITDSNFNRPLTICKLSKTQCPVDGDKVRYIFCERVRITAFLCVTLPFLQLNVFVSKIRLVVTRMLML